jgi:hypothetical protein
MIPGPPPSIVEVARPPTMEFPNMRTPKGYWEYSTRAGNFRIVPRADGRFVTMYEDEALDPYPSPETAAEALANGDGAMPSSGVDTSTLGIPEEIPA